MGKVGIDSQEFTPTNTARYCVRTVSGSRVYAPLFNNRLDPTLVYRINLPYASLKLAAKYIRIPLTCGPCYELLLLERVSVYLEGKLCAKFALEYRKSSN